MTDRRTELRNGSRLPDGFSHYFRDQTGQIKNASMQDCQFTEDGCYIATIAHNDSRLKVWDLEYPNMYERPKSYSIADIRLKKFRRNFYANMGLSSINLKPGSGLLAVGSLDGGAYLVNIGARDLLDTLHIIRTASEFKEEGMHCTTDLRFGPQNTAFKDKLFISYEQSYGWTRKRGCGELIRKSGHLKQWGFGSNVVPEVFFDVGMNAVSCFDICAQGSYLVCGVSGSGILSPQTEHEEEGDGVIRFFDMKSQLSTPAHHCKTNYVDHRDIKISPCGNYIAVCGASRRSTKPIIATIFDIRKLNLPLSRLSPSHSAGQILDLDGAVDMILWNKSGNLYSGDPDGCVSNK